MDSRLPARRLELWGVLFAVVAGTVLHFAWAWCGGCAWLAPFAAVNESVWEHLKLAFWPIVTWGVIELVILRRMPPNFCLAKAVAGYAAPLIIVAVFYAYTAVLGRHVPAIDIFSFVLAVTAGQLTSLRLTSVPCRGRTVNASACLAMKLLAAAFVLFTFRPPHLPLFVDPVTGRYGAGF